MAAKPLTPRQAEIKKMLDRGSEPGEIAVAVGTSAQAVYAQISRMRAAGHLPAKASGSNGGTRKPRKGRKPARRARAAQQRQDAALATAPEPQRLGVESKLSVEDHLAAELESVNERLLAIEREQTNLAAEHTTLTDRKARLETANTALTEQASAEAPAEAPQAA